MGKHLLRKYKQVLSDFLYQINFRCIKDVKGSNTKLEENRDECRTEVENSFLSMVPQVETIKKKDWHYKNQKLLYI